MVRGGQWIGSGWCLVLVLEFKKGHMHGVETSKGRAFMCVGINIYTFSIFEI